MRARCQARGLLAGVDLDDQRASDPLGVPLDGPLADVVNVQAWFLQAGVATSAMGLAAFFVPADKRIEDRKSKADPRH